MRRVIRWSITAALVCTGAVRAQTSGADSAAVANTVNRFHASLVKGDSAAALALLADDCVVLEAGGLENRDEYRAHHLPADIRFVRAIPGTRGALRVVVAGDVAWVSGTSESAGTYEGRAINSVGAELMVLSRTAPGSSDWKIRAIHWSSRRRAAQ